MNVIYTVNNLKSTASSAIKELCYQHLLAIWYQYLRSESALVWDLEVRLRGLLTTDGV